MGLRRFGGEWENVSLGALAEIRNGSTPRTTVPEYWDGDIPWCTPTDITAARGRHLVVTARSITVKGLDGCGATLLPRDALLLCSRATIGEVRIASMPVATNQGFKSLVCGESVDHEYLYYRLLMLTEHMVDLATGSTFLEISKRDVANIQLCLPPLPEQRAIAAVLSDVDALLGSLEALIAKKRSVKQAAMQQLLTGRTRLPGFGGEWGDRSLGALAEVRNGGTPRTTVPEYWDGDIAWCTPTDITSARGRHLVATARSITRKGLDGCGASLLPAGALLLCSRATIGEVRIASMCVATNQGFKSLVCGESVDHEYLYYRLLTLKEQMVDLATGSTFLEISKRDVANIRLRLPPLPEQRAIAAALSDMDEEIAALERRLDKTRAVKQGMMQQLLTGSIRLPIPDAVPENEPRR